GNVLDGVASVFTLRVDDRGQRRLLRQRPEPGAAEKALAEGGPTVLPVPGGPEASPGGLQLLDDARILSHRPTAGKKAPPEGAEQGGQTRKPADRNVREHGGSPWQANSSAWAKTALAGVDKWRGSPKTVAWATAGHCSQAKTTATHPDRQRRRDCNGERPGQ